MIVYCWNDTKGIYCCNFTNGRCSKKNVKVRGKKKRICSLFVRKDLPVKEYRGPEVKRRRWWQNDAIPKRLVKSLTVNPANQMDSTEIPKYIMDEE